MKYENIRSIKENLRNLRERKKSFVPASSPTVMAAFAWCDGGEPASPEITAADRNIISALHLNL